MDILVSAILWILRGHYIYIILRTLLGPFTHENEDHSFHCFLAHLFTYWQICCRLLDKLTSSLYTFQVLIIRQSLNSGITAHNLLFSTSFQGGNTRN